MGGYVWVGKAYRALVCLGTFPTLTHSLPLTHSVPSLVPSRSYQPPLTLGYTSFLPHTRWKRKSFVTAGKTWLVNVMSGQGVTSGYKGLTVPPGSELWVK